MVFKSDRQRKAVMAKLSGGVKSDVNPAIIKTGVAREGGDIIDNAPITAKSNPGNPNNNISKEEFRSFVRVRDSGVTNMFDTRAVSQFSGLEKEKIISIMKNFNSLSRKFPGVVK